MKALFLVLFFICLSVLPKKVVSNPKDGLSLELKGGFFLPEDSTLREIYSPGGSDVQLSFSFPLFKKNFFQMKGYTSLEFIYMEGESLNTKEKTTLMQIPYSLGVKPTFSMGSYSTYYLTLGPKYFYILQRNDSSFVDKKNGTHVFGGFINTGLNIFLYPSLFLDIFAEYSYGKGDFSSSLENVFAKKINIGGFTFGLGLGWSF